MNYQVLSRKYRPQTFNEIIGQPHVVDTLINSIELDRIAHSYLLSGLRGVGIDEIREIKETVKYPPISSLYKIFIIDEVHMLTKEAFNALLKTLEEPPNNVIFILATTDPFKIPDTILSRTLRFDFKRVSNDEISNLLKNILSKEKIKYEELALDTIAFKAEGSVRDALSMLDKIIAYSHSNVSYDLVKDSLGIIEDKVFLQLFDDICNNNTSSLLSQIKEIMDSGYSISDFISGFNIFLSNCLLYTSGYENNKLINQETEEWLNKNNKLVINIDIMRLIDEIQKYELKSKYLLQPDIALESLFVRLAVMDRSIQISDLLNRLKNPKKNIKNDKSNKIEEKNNLTNANEKLEAQNNKNKNDIVDTNIKEVKNDKKVTVEVLIKKWDEILKLVDAKDRRLSNFLEGSNLELNKEILLIKLNDKNNSFSYKTLNDNISFIEDCVYEIVHKKITIDIVGEFKTNEEEEEHPLLDAIKEKFEGDTIR